MLPTQSLGTEHTQAKQHVARTWKIPDGAVGWTRANTDDPTIQTQAWHRRTELCIVLVDHDTSVMADTVEGRSVQRNPDCDLEGCLEQAPPTVLQSSSRHTNTPIGNNHKSATSKEQAVVPHVCDEKTNKRTSALCTLHASSEFVDKRWVFPLQSRRGGRLGEDVNANLVGA